MNQLFSEISHGIFFIAPKFAPVYAVQVAAYLKQQQDLASNPSLNKEPSDVETSSEGNLLMFDQYVKANDDFEYAKKFFQHVKILIPSASGVAHVERGFGGLQNAPEGSTAVINISGAITKYDQYCGPDGMLTIARMSHEVLSYKNISQLIYQLETPGGSAYAADFMNREIQRMRAQYGKPIKAYVDDICCSGGVYIAVACDEIHANTSKAMIGSIGTMITLWDQRKYLEKEGINLVEIYATRSTDKNKKYKDALDGKPDEIIRELDVHNADFHQAVINGRPQAKEHQSAWETGKVFFASEALKLGLIDGIKDKIEDLI